MNFFLTPSLSLKVFFSKTGDHLATLRWGDEFEKKSSLRPWDSILN